MTQLTHSFEINAAPPVLSAEQTRALQEIVTPFISDNLHRQVGPVGFTRYNRAGKLVGSALTVKTRPGDNLFIYKAMTLIRPGHVLVVDAGGETRNACVGEIMKRYLQQQGCVGLIVDGAIRDVAAFEQDDFPCYARGHIHRGPYKDGPGAVNVPVCVGGQVVNPGDIVVGDEDGIAVFPPELIDELIQACQAQALRETAIMEEIATGRAEQSWLQRVLQAKGL